MADYSYRKFKMLMDENHVSAYQVSKDTGISQATLSSWKKGRYIPKSDKMKIIADYFEVPMQWLYDDEAEERSAYEVAAGQGRINDDYGTDEYSEVKVVGDSMFPSLHDGDRLLVSHTFELSDISPSDFVVVRIDGEASAVKHIEMCSNGIWLRGENANAYTDTFYSMQDVLTLPVTIIGKAVEIISRKL